MSAFWKCIPRHNMRRLFVLTGLLAWPKVTLAHAFAQTYQLPMPYWLYIYGAVGALILSFVVVGLVVQAVPKSVSADRLVIGHADWRYSIWGGVLMHALKIFSVFVLALCIATGLLGTNAAQRNFNMTFVWVIVVLGGTYAAAVIGNWYSILSPWKLLSRLLGHVWTGYQQGRFRYPQRLAYWPAVLFYMAFIWLELMGEIRPISLSFILLAYTGVNLLGVGVYGARAWFRYCEFFAVFMQLIAKMAPIEYKRDQNGSGRLLLRWPLAGLLDGEPEHLSALVFIFFMLSSTAFDGLAETVFWFRLFWLDPTGLFTWGVGAPPLEAYAEARQWYALYEAVWLIASPFLYLGAYWFFIVLGRFLARSTVTTYQLALRFGYTLLPIVLAYHVSHYYSLLYTQGSKIVGLMSDPFGWGWDLFGTVAQLRGHLVPDMGFVWYSQVWLILAGHVASVYLAHVVSLQVFSTRRQALLSQVPMLVMMVLLTGVGLWIMAQPLQGR